MPKPILRAIGFHPTEELQPARHRMALAIDGAGEDDLFAGVTKQTRQRIRSAEGEGIIVRRFDRQAPRFAATATVP